MVALPGCFPWLLPLTAPPDCPRTPHIRYPVERTWAEHSWLRRLPGTPDLNIGDRVRLVPFRCSPVTHLARTSTFIDEQGTVRALRKVVLKHGV